MESKESGTLLVDANSPSVFFEGLTAGRNTPNRQGNDNRQACAAATDDYGDVRIVRLGRGPHCGPIITNPLRKVKRNLQ